jgi:hypothetical protein
MPMDRHLTGAGLVIGARARLDAFPTSADVCFVDCCDLPSLRASHPQWRSQPLAPIELLDRTGTLAEIADESQDFVIDWAMLRDADQTVLRLRAATRVLRPGGVLVLPVCDSRFFESDAEAESIFAGLDRLAARPKPMDGSVALQRQRRDRWTLARFATVIATLAIDQATYLELEQVRRYGLYNLALLRRRRDQPIKGPCVIACGAHCYVLDGPLLRHITSLNTLNKLQAANVPTIRIGVAEQALFVAGPPLNPNDVAEFIAKTDVLS